tara:strand:- start:38 stop:193 length:156 start_codon:yes stop_codon:yes gene_type:complete
MARKKQIKFTADLDIEKLIAEALIEYPYLSLSKIINVMLREKKTNATRLKK